MSFGPAKITWEMRRHRVDGRNVYSGSIFIPLIQADGGVKYLKASSAVPGMPGVPTTKGEALQQASSLASRIIGNPILQAALPPGTGVAVKAIDYIANSEAAGQLASAAKNVVGKGAKRLFDALKFW